MIVVVGRVRTVPEKRAALVQIGQTLAQASRQEPGCISYGLYEDSENANEFLFVEEWESDEALREHFRTPHIAEFMKEVPTAVAAAPDVKFHTIASSVDLADVGGG